MQDIEFPEGLSDDEQWEYAEQYVLEQLQSFADSFEGNK